jgi:hypothetical protein
MFLLLSRTLPGSLVALLAHTPTSLHHRIGIVSDAETSRARGDRTVTDWIQRTVSNKVTSLKSLSSAIFQI